MELEMETIVGWVLTVGGLVATGFGTILMFLLRHIYGELRGLRKEIGSMREEIGGLREDTGTLWGTVQGLPCRFGVSQVSQIREGKHVCLQHGRN